MRKTITPTALDPKDVREIIARYTADHGDVSSLADIRIADLKRVLADDRDGLMAATVTQAKQALENPEIGFAAIDIPELSDNSQQNSLFGCLAASAFQVALSEPVEDRNSGTPFTLYNASQENEDKLVDAGLKFYSPEDRLGFHTDGLILNDKICVPRYVSVYNVMIAYRKPGNFFFLPFAMWDEYERYKQAFGVNKDVSFSMTPIVYAGENGEISALESKPVTAPLFWQNGSSETMFYNGDIDTGPSELIALANDMKESLLDNPKRLTCPIRNRRMFVMANDKGFHARDIFADPIEGVKYTRSFLRFVSHDAICVKETSKAHAA